MSDLFDYLEWRGDIPFRMLPVMEADYAVFCCLSYIPFDGVISSHFSRGGARLSKAIPKVIDLTGKTGDGRSFQMKEDQQFLNKLLDCPRYSKVELCGFVNKYDADLEEQFCAITFKLTDDSIAVVFRGTDRTLIGWKEDLNMGYKEQLPAHKDAVKYLERAAKRFEDCNIYVCGHSKGGNLAMFASANCPEDIQDRIVAVRNLDGPGFHKEEVRTEGYARIRDRAVTYIPQASIVGVLLEHAEPSYVVHSHSPSLMQHHVYSWDIRRGEFEMDDGVTDSSIVIDSSIREWLEKMSPEDRERMTNSLFELVNSSGARTIDDLLDPKNIITVMKAWGQRDEDTKQLLDQTYKLFYESIKKSLPKLRQRDKTHLAKTDENEGDTTADVR